MHHIDKEGLHTCTSYCLCFFHISMLNKVQSLTKQLTIKDREEQKMLEQTKNGKKVA